MINKEKITISISSDLLKKVDDKVDKINFKNRSHVIEGLIREGLQLRQDLGAIIIAHEKRWNNEDYPLDYPKSLIKIDGKTLIEKQLEILKKANVEKCIIAVSYKKDDIIKFLKSKRFGIDIEFYECSESDESQKIIYQASKLLKTNKTLVFLGDNYFHNFNLTDFIYYHNTNSQDISIVVKTIEASEGYGNIKLEGNNVVKFVEKPKSKEDISFIANTGIYIINTSVLPITNENLKIEKDFFPNFVQHNKVKAYFHNGKWFHLQDTKTLEMFN